MILSSLRHVSLPRVTPSLTTMQAIDVLSSYLTSSPTAPLNKEFVEIESPLWCVLLAPYMKVVLTGCSTYIYIGVELRATLSDLMIYAVSVPTEHLDTFGAKLHESLSRIAKDGVDQNRMRMVIDRDERQVFFRFMALFQHFLIVF